MTDQVATTWVFDVDGTLIDAMTGRSLRPLANELLAHLSTAGVTLILWSAGGADYARRRAEEHGVDHWFSRFLAKQGRDDVGRYLTSSFLTGHDDVVFVDDMPNDLPIGANVIGVRPYIAANTHDRGLDVVARRLGAQLV
jgi:phosphoglycolate phosphatase-like HAD superfamily hydrolase